MSGIVDRLLGGIVAPIAGIVDQVVPDKDQAERLKAELRTQILSGGLEELRQQVSIVLAEIQGQSWLQRNWRPLLMTVITAIIANNYLLAPYLQAMFGVGLMLDLPERLWDLMTLGVGGYVAGRTIEKGIETWKRSG